MCNLAAIAHRFRDHRLNVIAGDFKHGWSLSLMDMFYPRWALGCIHTCLTPYLWVYHQIIQSDSTWWRYVLMYWLNSTRAAPTVWHAISQLLSIASDEGFIWPRTRGGFSSSQYVFGVSSPLTDLPALSNLWWFTHRSRLLHLSLKSARISGPTMSMSMSMSPGTVVEMANNSICWGQILHSPPFNFLPSRAMDMIACGLWRKAPRYWS